MKLLILFVACCIASVFADEIKYEYLPVINDPVISAVPPTFLNVPRSSRVIGGSDAPRGMYPYMVRLFMGVPGGIILCGGSLISMTHVLSADHCIPDNLNSVDAHLGVTHWNGPDHVVISIGWFVRRGQATNPFVDLAIFGLNWAITINDVIRPAQVPRMSQSNEFFTGREGWIPGWGGVTDNILKHIPVRYVPTPECGTSIGMICSVGRDSTDQRVVGGDSGGPMVIQEGSIHILVGVVSFGFNNRNGGSLVGMYLPWIRDVTGIHVDP